jgi:hypothetical protein
MPRDEGGIGSQRGMKAAIQQGVFSSSGPGSYLPGKIEYAYHRGDKKTRCSKTKIESPVRVCAARKNSSIQKYKNLIVTVSIYNTIHAVMMHGSGMAS